VKLIFPNDVLTMKRNCKDFVYVISTTLHIKQDARTGQRTNMYNLINSCGSASPAINEGKEVELLRLTKKYNTQLLSRKKTSVSKDRITEFLI
jgi:hypothetical protein